MGDRGLVIFTDGKDVSATTYLHWNGTEIPAWLEEHKALMAGRIGDVPYACARFIGICHKHIDGNTSLGVWSTSDKLENAVNAFLFGTDKEAKTAAEKELREASHGDAGIVIVEVENFTWTAIGGYLDKEREAA